jgi:hypothetical protein
MAKSLIVVLLCGSLFVCIVSSQKKALRSAQGDAAVPLVGSRTPVLASPLSRPTASLPPEVRLRKLHLVRPDLILYPIAYEIVC